MNQYSKSSQEKLDGCHEDLQVIFSEVIKYFDNSIICGHRGEIEQNNVFNKGYSKVKFPNSKHNKIPSMAVDSIPYPIEWNNTNRMRFYAGFVLGIAKQLKKQGGITHELRLGIDWDMDTELKDNRFNDFPHFELIDL